MKKRRLSATGEPPAPAPDPATSEPDRAGPPPPAPSARPDKSAPPLTSLFGLDPAAGDDQIQDPVNQQVDADVRGSGLLTTHTVIVLHDDHSLTRFAADRIYEALRTADPAKPILLILNSSGGDVAAAYMISKLCREHTKNLFEVAIPRRAKSAATLISCGADRIHMGSLSELGPIDPQFGALPALALKYSVEHLAELVGKYPAANTMFSDYLSKSLRVEALGYFERVAESAVQYAIRLLASRRAQPKKPDRDAIAKRLVYFYKDHGFVIDSREAADIFGAEIIAVDSDAYRMSNKVFGTLDVANWVCGRRYSREFSYIGAPGSGCMVWDKTPE